MFGFTPLIQFRNSRFISNFPCLLRCTSVPYRLVRYSSVAKRSWPIVQRSNYVSGRDRTSVEALSSLLSTLEAPRAKPHEVATVRDPVLSDVYYTDVDGACWKQSEGAVGVL